MANPTDQRLRIAAARADFLSSGHAGDDAVSDVVAASWKRSISAGADLSEVEATYHNDLDTKSRLVRCSEPIIIRLREETADIPLSIALTDGKARILTRWDTDQLIGMMCDRVSFAGGFEYAETGVGTNGVGTVFESGGSIFVVGPEHIHERLQAFACAGAPIRDPLTRRVEGVLDISALTEHSSPLMHSLVRSAALDIERNLLIDRSQCQQALFETFVRFDTRTRNAVIAVGGSVVMANAMVQSLFDPSEQQSIHEHARYLMAQHDRPVDQIELLTGKVVRMRGARIVVGNDIAGLVLELRLISEAASMPAETGAFEDRTLPAVSGRCGGRGYESAASLRAPASPISQGHSPAWRRACDDITEALRYHDALLVMGEHGTGKFSLVAEIYHRVNPGGRSFAIDAADISCDSYVEAEEALKATTVPTLYIFRNIDNLSTDGVERLHAFLETLADIERPAYVAATLSEVNLDSDLPFHDLLIHFQRAVTVPPLRHRAEDLPALVTQVLTNIADRRGVRVSLAAMRVIRCYTWPRNFRQLDEALRAALLRRPVGELQPEDLPGYCHGSARRQLSGIESVERDAIVQALLDADGNRIQAAAALGIARSSLYRKLKSYGITTL
ncbi:transcriptional regulator [Candidatus Protofrankia californiensis]|uniref:Transcriptional regulator n=1 Tax=Candidatus Protofrankia californiensis TaxID=1839754 RepID=A0A1C3NTE2_9ACTN|nr:transcriptional regulator [Candidatus Protofrankia californiensis]